MNLIPSPLFYCKNKDTYPPFKNGFYLEEFFLNKIKEKNNLTCASGRIYIPALWTNFQLEPWFMEKKYELQTILDEWIKKNPSSKGYFTIVQYDDGPLLKLPQNTIIYGACSGTTQIPLIYQDITNKLDSVPKLSWKDKDILCSFVGTLTHDIRRIIKQKYINNPLFVIKGIDVWSPVVDNNKQDTFIHTTIHSKFALAPRGYGRSSFRFFEIFKLGTIPIYVWDDIEWLPYKDMLDYSKFCISIQAINIDKLENIIKNITEKQYNNMWIEYNKIKHCFGLDFMVDYVCGK